MRKGILLIIIGIVLSIVSEYIVNSTVVVGPRPQPIETTVFSVVFVISIIFIIVGTISALIGMLKKEKVSIK